jgi:phosphatidylglycerol:prolipoprotein diacylglycerol transferase
MHPYLVDFWLGDFRITIGTYSILALAGILATGFIYIFHVQDGRKKVAAHILFIGGILLFSLIGARIVQFLIDLKVKAGEGLSPWEILVSTGGTVTGGLVFATIGTVIYSRIDPHRIMNWQTTDVMAMSFPFGHMLGRIGCFTAGCCYGRVCYDCGITVTYPDSWPVLLFKESGFAQGPRLASPLIAAIGLLVIGIALYLIFRLTRSRGQVTALYFLLYGPFRFFQEFTRGDPERGFFGPFSTGQWFGLFATVLGIVLLIVYIRRFAAGAAYPPFLPFNGKPPREKDAFQK